MKDSKTAAVMIVRYRCPGCLGEFVAGLPPFEKKLPRCPSCKRRGWLVTHPNLDRLHWGV